MPRYIIRRILVSIPVLVVIVLAVFLLARVIPGNPCVATLGERPTQEQCRQFAIRFGLDQPYHVQFVNYLKDVLSGDLGSSVQYHESVTQLVSERLPTTIELSIFALIFAISV